jgi:hypothetical protein
MSRFVTWMMVAGLLPAAACGSSSKDQDLAGVDAAAVDVAYDGVEDLATDGVVPADGLGDVPLADMGPDAAPCPMTLSSFGFRDNCDGTVTDTNTGLTWEKGYSWAASRAESLSLCEAAQTGTHEDWRTPTVDELRTLILGCAATGPAGTCDVTHNASGSCDPYGSSGTCPLSSACLNGCGTNQGPVEKPGDATKKCYLDATFDWYCNLFWSASQIKAKSATDKRSWYVTFYDGAVNTWPSVDTITSSALRCVRGP